jgi:hypothetical protein
VNRKRRYGRFTIPVSWIDEYRSEALRVMGKCAILKAEMLYTIDAIEYWARSDHFREIADGEVVPEYIWTFSDDGDFGCTEVKVAHHL